MEESIQRIPRLLIPDTSPLSLLSMAGREALDYLFVPGVEVWMTDMVEIEATRSPIRTTINERPNEKSSPNGSTTTGIGSM